MIIRVDREACTGHARCNAILADVFTLDEVGYSSVDQATVPPGEEDLARLAVASCPEKAISVAEE